MWGKAASVEMNGQYIILFDGVCNLCNGSVNFILARDPRELFLFSPVQSAFADDLLKKHGLQGIGDESFVLVKNGKCYLRSDAALQISRELSGLWSILYVLRFVPRFVRNQLYDLVARHRYRVFGKKEHCMVPTKKLQRRFITDIQ